jgi:hypothetical protein
MYYRRLKFSIIYLALNRGCFEAVLVKNTPRTLGINQIYCCMVISKLTNKKLKQWS